MAMDYIGGRYEFHFPFPLDYVGFISSRDVTKDFPWKQRQKLP